MMSTSLSNVKYFESLCFDDVLLRPRHSGVKSRSHININSKLSPNNNRQINLKIPLISSPMDTVTDSEMAIHMALNGGLGIIHRFMSLDEQVAEVARVKRYVNYVFYEPYTISPSATVMDAIKTIKYNGVTTLCVCDNIDSEPKNYKLKGILTRRNIQPYIDKLDNKSTPTELDMELSLDTCVENVMTPMDELITINTSCESLDIIENDPQYLDDIMNLADKLMADYHIEKIPITQGYWHQDHEYGDDDDQIISSGKLIGIITRRSIDFYMRRRQFACLDKQGRLCVGAAVGIKPGLEDRASKLVNAGVDLLCVDVANGHNKYTVSAVEKLRSLFPNTTIMAGNVVTAEGYNHLAEAGADCVRVGIGNGSICTTRLETGVGYGQFSAVQEIYYASLLINDITKRPVIISDGGSLGKTGNKMKALAAGADAVMLGRSLASCEESPGSIIIKNGKRMKYYRGMASTMASLSNQEQQNIQDNRQTKDQNIEKNNKSDGQPFAKRAKHQPVKASEGVDGMVEVQCSVREKLETISAGIKSGMSYLDVFSMDELELIRKERKIEWARCTSIGMSETGTRVHKF